MMVRMIAPGIFGRNFLHVKSMINPPINTIVLVMSRCHKEVMMCRKFVYIFELVSNADRSIPNPPASWLTRIVIPTAKRNHCSQAAGISVTYFTIFRL